MTVMYKIMMAYVFQLWKMLLIYIAVFFTFQSWLILIIYTAMALLAINMQH